MSRDCGSIGRLAVDKRNGKLYNLKTGQTVVNDGVKIRLGSGSTVDWHALLFNAWDRQRIIDVSLPSTSK